jgi:hypothetical protein
MRRWPDLALRARTAERKKNWPGKREGWSEPKTEEAPKIGDILAVLLNKVVAESIEIDRGMTEDEYVAHLKECVSCRKNVASFARMGVKIPSRILVAAGVEVLN